MSLLFMDGFDAGDTLLKWIASAAGSSSGTRFGVGKSLDTVGSSLTRMVPSSTQLFVGAAVFQGTTTDIIFILRGDTNTVTHLTLRGTSAGGIEVCRSTGTVLATSAPNLITLGTWNYVEISAIISDTVGAVVVRLNGVIVITFNGDTKNAGTVAALDAVQLPSNGPFYDDLYICNSLGTVNNTFLGDVRVQTLIPSGPGASTQFIPVGSVNNWDNVNDIPYNPVTYNASSIPGQRDTYAMSDLLEGTAAVFGVQDNIIALKTDAGVASFKAAIKSGVTIDYDTPMVLGNSPIISIAIREIDPATSAAWIVDDVNALEFGVEVV